MFVPEQPVGLKVSVAGKLQEEYGPPGFGGVGAVPGLT